MDEKFVHEVVAHQGIRALLGDEKADAFYTAVYHDFAADPELAAVIEKYGLAQQDDYGDQMREKMTAGQKVEAGEEFVSRLAEESVKPEAQRAPWYERALFKLRELLRKLFPKLRISRRDIEALLREAAYKLRRGRMRQGKTGEGEGVRLALCEFEDHTRFVDVQADQSLFDGLSPREAGVLAQKIIREKFVGKVIGLDNPVFVNGVGAGEYRSPAKPIDDKNILSAKMRAGSELDNLVDAGKPLPDKADGEGGHFHPQAIGGFSYLETIFKVGNEYYKGTVNIINNRRGRLFKDVTKIENITKTITNSYGQNPKFGFLRDVSMPNIDAFGGNSSGEIRKAIEDEPPIVEPKPFDPARDVDYEDADQRAVQVLIPRYGAAAEFDDAEAAEYLHGCGFDDITPQQAHKLVARAREEYRRHRQSEIRHNNARRRDDWLYDNVPIYRHAVDFGGKGFKIKLDKRVAHKDDSGTFLAGKNEGGRKRICARIWPQRRAPPGWRSPDGTHR